MTNLEYKVLLSIQVSRCTNENCVHHHFRVQPAVYLNQIVPNSGYGIEYNVKPSDKFA
ncbi:MAG: hypothetical protein AAGI49_07250 [Bacteroidota bacterium]